VWDRQPKISSDILGLNKATCVLFLKSMQQPSSGSATRRDEEKTDEKNRRPSAREEMGRGVGHPNLREE
jgi:hypothetical protein